MHTDRLKNLLVYARTEKKGIFGRCLHGGGGANPTPGAILASFSRNKLFLWLFVDIKDK
jgi:hypothetical protein